MTELGSGPRVVLVHGSVTNGASAWARQRPLADRFRLVVLDRPGFPPNPPVPLVDFEDHARLVERVIEPGDHVVGHSYGGVIALLAAAATRDRVRSLTVIEPPAFGVAAGDPVVDEYAARLRRHWDEPPDDPEAFLRGFARQVMGGEEYLPAKLGPDLLQGARTLMVERYPGEAQIPLETLAAARFPKLVVSGAHHAVYDRICDILEERLGAERAVIPGAAHAAQRAPGFNDVLVDFLARAEDSSTRT